MPAVSFRQSEKISQLGPIDDLQIVDSYFIIQMFQHRYSPDLYDLAHVAGWDSYRLHDPQ